MTLQRIIEELENIIEQASVDEGIEKEKVHFVGNCMIDSVKKFLSTALEKKTWKKYGKKVVQIGNPKSVNRRLSFNCER